MGQQTHDGDISAIKLISASISIDGFLLLREVRP
jgi:hypothetical protein